LYGSVTLLERDILSDVAATSCQEQAHQIRGSIGSWGAVRSVPGDTVDYLGNCPPNPLGPALCVPCGCVFKLCPQYMSGQNPVTAVNGNQYVAYQAKRLPSRVFLSERACLEREAVVLGPILELNHQALHPNGYVSHHPEMDDLVRK